MRRHNFFINKTYSDNTVDNGLLEKAFMKTTDSMLYEEAFVQLFKDKKVESVDFLLNQDDQNLFKFDSVYEYFDLEKLINDDEVSNTEDNTHNTFDDILDDVFKEDENDTLDNDELEKIKRNIFSELVCNDILDILQRYIDGSDKASKSAVKDYIREIAPGYVEKQNEAQTPNLGKDTTELIKLFKKRQSNINN